MSNQILNRIAALISYCEGEEILEEYRHQQLERFIKSQGWREVLHQLPSDKRTTYRYYLSHRKGECSFSTVIIPKLDAIATILQTNEEKKLNQRWVVYDQINNLYWAAIMSPPFFRGKRYCLLFQEKDYSLLKQMVERANKKVGKRQLILEKIDATKRLQKSL